MNRDSKGEMPLKGQKVVLVVAPNEYRDEELDIPLQYLEAAGASTSVASTRTGRCLGMLGGNVEATIATTGLRAKEWDSVVIVGGMGSPEHLWNDAPLLDFVAKLRQEGKAVAAICLSGAVLAKAGALQGVRATVWPESKAIEALKQAGAKYEKAPVVSDGLVVTGEGPLAAIPFAEALVEALVAATQPARR